MRSKTAAAALLAGHALTGVSGAAAGPSDPLVCPVLAALSPGVPGAIDIGADGDIAIAGEPVWDCPPST